MNADSSNRPLWQGIIEAASGAGALSAILAIVSFIAWTAGLVSPGDAAWVLAGIFAGSFTVSLFGQDRPRRRTDR